MMENMGISTKFDRSSSSATAKRGADDRGSQLLSYDLNMRLKDSARAPSGIPRASKVEDLHSIKATI